MDKETTIKLLAGTVARGILWGAGFVSQSMGVSFVAAENEAWAAGLAAFLIGTGFEIAALYWSKKKDAKLLATPPK